MKIVGPCGQVICAEKHVPLYRRGQEGGGVSRRTVRHRFDREPNPSVLNAFSHARGMTTLTDPETVASCR